MKNRKTLKLPAVQVIGFIGLAVLVVSFLVAAHPAPQSSDVDACADCHEDVAKAYLSMPHAANTCTDCHGSAETHLEEGGGPNIFAFKDTDVTNQKSKKCLTCHAKDNARYFASPHGKSSMDCTACHSVHGSGMYPALLKTSANKNCSQCHEDIFALFQLNERHRLQEGLLDCATCHDPHEPVARERLGGFKHEACLKCHTDKGGPFLYEHGASRVEGCTVCHEVHGSPNRRMLTSQSISDLCFSCHALAPSWHSRFTSEGTNCTVCHSTIHGSNLSKIFLK